MTFIQDDSWVAKLEELYFDTLMHFGVGHDEDPPGRGSGRYPYGTGDRQLQHNWEIYARIDTETKRTAIEKACKDIFPEEKTTDWTADEDLMSFLETLV